MHEKIKADLDQMGAEYPYLLEARFARILDRVALLWGSPRLDDYFSELLIDDKGDRQGFPPEIAKEIMLLSLAHSQMLMERGMAEQDIWADVTVQQKLDELNIEYSPRGFFKALDAGNIKAVELFISAGVNLEITNDEGWTPLMISSFMGHEAAAELLIKAGANVNARDNRGYGPMHWAAYCGYSNIIQMLIQRGARVDSRSDKGITPLLQAAARGHVEVVRTLIDNYAEVNASDDEGWTALHKAVSNGHLEVVKLLMAAHADPNIAHNTGLTAMQIGLQKNNQAVLMSLRGVE